MSISNLYYKLTAWYPRLRPQTEAEIEELKKILIEVHGLKDDPTIWYMVFSQLTSGEPTSMRRSHLQMANAAKRLRVNELAQDQKILAGESIRLKAETKIKEMNDRSEVQCGTSDLQGELQSVPESAN